VPAKSFVSASVATLLILLGTAACAGSPDIGDGPAEVSVEKAPLPVSKGSQKMLDRLNKDAVPGASVLPWGQSDEKTWLPEAESVLRGLGDSTEKAGSLYLRVPASYDVTSQALEKNQTPGPGVEISTTRSESPVGTVVDVTTDGIYYILSASPDTEGRDGFSIVLVQWGPVPPEPAPSPTVPVEPTTTTPATQATPAP
jgi:hypothetical protein